MGIVTDIPICRDLLSRATSLFNTISNHTITKNIITFALFLNFHVQELANYLYKFGREIYYTHIDTDYESLNIKDTNKNDQSINIMYYSNYKTNQYAMFKSNTMTFEEHSLEDPVTRDFINSELIVKNPLISSILTIKDEDNEKEFTLEVNKLLEPFIFKGNRIEGNINFISYLINEYIKEDITNNNNYQVDLNSLNNFNGSLTYITLDTDGIETINDLKNSEWLLHVTDDYKIEVELVNTNEL